MSNIALRSFVCIPALIAASVSAFSAPAIAQDMPAAPQTDDNAGTDIVVTAQKRTETLRDTAASVAVVSADTLVASGVSTLDDMGKTVPSFTALPSSTTLRPSFTLRGVSTDVLTVGAPSGVAVMVDGVTLAPESLAAKQLVDIANVEVLRGPQSTLGGRTASVGVINIVTRKPSDVWTGKASATATTDNEYRASAFIAGPITQGLSFSLSGFGGSTQFLTRNLTTGKHDRSSSEGVRGKLLFQPTDNLDITLSGTYVHTRDRGSYQAYINVDSTALFRGTISQALALPGITPSRDNTDYRTITTPGQNVKDQLYSLVIDYRIGDFTLSSVTARQVEDRLLRVDLYNEAADWRSIASGGAFPFNNIQTSDLSIRGLSQELKLVSPDLGIMRFIAGLYYDHSKTGFQFDRRSLGFAPLLFAAFRQPDSKNYAAYARADWTLTDSTKLITGLRFNRDKIAYIYQLQTPQATGTNLIQFTRTDDYAKSTWVGDVTLKQELSRFVNVYGTYSHGYKPAIWNLDGAVTATNTFNPVGREKVDSFELGLKGDFLDRILSLNVSAFYSRYKDFQVQALDFSNALGATTFDVRNAGQASTRGIEVDGIVRATRNTNINFSGAWIKARFDKFPGAICYSGQTTAQGCNVANNSQDLSGVALPRSPRWKFNVGVDQTVDLTSDFDLKLGATFNYQSKINFDPSHSPRAFQNGYGILNLNAALAQKDDSYKVTLFVNNVTDKLYVSNISELSARWGNKSAVTGWYSRDAHRYAGIRLDANF